MRRKNIHRYLLIRAAAVIKWGTEKILSRFFRKKAATRAGG